MEDRCFVVADLIEILSLDCPSGHTTEFYRNYLNLLLSIFYHACRSLSELSYLVSRCARLVHTTLYYALWLPLSKIMICRRWCA